MLYWVERFSSKTMATLDFRIEANGIFAKREPKTAHTNIILAFHQCDFSCCDLLPFGNHLAVFQPYDINRAGAATD